jgi:TolC family type I secretion outer membrane protein
LLKTFAQKEVKYWNKIITIFVIHKNFITFSVTLVIMYRTFKTHIPGSVRKGYVAYMQKSYLLLITALLIIPCHAGAEDLIRKGDTLDLTQCIEIALKKQPSIVAATNILKVNESKVGQAKANYYPQLNWSSNYSRISPAQTTLLRKNDAYDDYQSNLTLSQNIYDFEKTSTQVKIQRLNLDSSRSDFENVSILIVFGVKQAYFSALQAKRNRDVAEETVQQFKQHLDRAKGFFEVGVKPKFDVTKAEVDLSNAKLNLIKMENALRIARVNLNNAIGVPEAPEFTIVDDFIFRKYEISLEDAVKRAYAGRPDLLSLSTKKEAAERTIDLQKKGYFPTLSGNASYGFSGEDFPLEKGWNIGATLTFPLFSGLLTKYQVEEARANLDVLKANEESLKQTIHLDVQQAHLNLREASDRISTTELTVRQANENLELANGRYAAGVGNPIEVTDALVALSNAKTAYIAALYDYKIAQASMEKAMGTK